MGLLWGVAFRPVDLALLVGHVRRSAPSARRSASTGYFTHRASTRAPSLKATLAILGCMTMQGPITQWVTDHRKHHALSDQEGDPHSPARGHGEGSWASIQGFFHAHVGWLFSNQGHGARARTTAATSTRTG